MSTDLSTRWYLQEWMAEAGKRQSDLVKELDWPKSKANKVWHGDQRYNADIVSEVAAWLNVLPYELLMPPEEARRFREIRKIAAAIVAETGAVEH